MLLQLFLSLSKTRAEIMHVSIRALNETNFIYVYFHDTCGTSSIDPHNQPSHARTQMHLYSPYTLTPFGTLYRATSSEGLHARALFMSEGESFSKFGVYSRRRESVSREDECLARPANPIARLMHVSLPRRSLSLPSALLLRTKFPIRRRILFIRMRSSVCLGNVGAREYRSNHLSHFRPSSSYSILSVAFTTTIIPPRGRSINSRL